MYQRGGHQQKRHAHGGSSGSKVDLEDKCALWAKLVDLWSWGVISAGTSETVLDH